MPQSLTAGRSGSFPWNIFVSLSRPFIVVKDFSRALCFVCCGVGNPFLLQEHFEFYFVANGDTVYARQGNVRLESAGLVESIAVERREQETALLAKT